MRVDEVRSILLIEDNPDHADLVEAALRECLPAATVEWVDHGARAMERLVRLADKGAAPDLVLLDLNLPGYRGHEVLRRCRSHDALRALSIVVLTSSDAPADYAQAEAAGADGYLTKASPGTTLGGRLIELLEALGG